MRCSGAGEGGVCVRECEAVFSLSIQGFFRLVCPATDGVQV